jgi:hypothetical protein
LSRRAKTEEKSRLKLEWGKQKKINEGRQKAVKGTGT